jgi:hypothetical protein
LNRIFTHRNPLLEKSDVNLILENMSYSILNNIYQEQMQNLAKFGKIWQSFEWNECEGSTSDSLKEMKVLFSSPGRSIARL